MANAKKQLKVSDEVAIQITKMNKWFGSFHVLRDIDLNSKSWRKNSNCGAIWLR